MMSLLSSKRSMSILMGGQSRIRLRLVGAAHSWMHCDILRVGKLHFRKQSDFRLHGLVEERNFGLVPSEDRRRGSFPIRCYSERQVIPISALKGSRGVRTKNEAARSRSSVLGNNPGAERITQRGDAKYIDWWEERMNDCQKSSTKEMIKRLVYTNLLGVNSSLRMGNLKEGSIASELVEIKRRFPHEVILCRIGEFYETLGFDACVLVEYAGLNPMGGLKSDAVPKAGCPIVNLRQTLDDLTRHGFSVCIVEEVKGPSIGKHRKDRFIAGHAHPGSPYVYGLAEADLDVDFPDPVPVIGIARSALGYRFISVVEMMRTVSVDEQLTEEAVVAKLRAKPYQRLFLHKTLKYNSSETVRWGEFGEGGLLWGECRGKLYEWYENEPVSELLSRVRELYDLNPDMEFRRIVTPPGERPRPLYVGTAAQAGVLPTQGVPSLLKVLLPRDVNGLCTSYLRDLLLSPPPYQVASRIQQAVRLMTSINCSIPDFTCVSAAKLVKLIGAREANHIEFGRLKNMAEDVLMIEKDSQLTNVLSLLLDPTWLATGLRIGREQLVEDCSFFVERLSDVLAVAGDPDNVVSRSKIVPEEFFQDMEVRWRGRVRRDHVESAYSEVDRAAARLEEVLDEEFSPIVMRTRALATPIGSGKGGPKVEIVHSREHRGVWLKGKHFIPSVWGGTPGEEEIKRLKPALDSKGRKLGDEWYTSKRVDLALDDYRSAVENASVAVLECLKRVAEELQYKLNSVVFVATISIIAKTLFSHVSEARRRRWVVPAMTEPFDGGENEKANDINRDNEDVNIALYLQDMFPYWLDRNREQAVLNTVQMSSMFLLTGPNGGGKSSLLRSICAVSLLATCGLMVPCRSAVVPRLDSIMLRMMISDSPADGKSSFQMEMAELRSIASEATSRSLVLYDELCKGTEVNKGTFLVASVLEHLDQVGCLGVISTHLHGLLDMELNTKRVVRMAMGAKLVNGRPKPTWKLRDGECRESLAFETARKEGVSDSIVDRAEKFYKEWKRMYINGESQEVDEISFMPVNVDTSLAAQGDLPRKDQSCPTGEVTAPFSVWDQRFPVVDGNTKTSSATVSLCSRKTLEVGSPRLSSAEKPSTLSPRCASAIEPCAAAEISPSMISELSYAEDAFARVKEPLNGVKQPDATKEMLLKVLCMPKESDVYSVSGFKGLTREADVGIDRAFIRLCKEKLSQLQLKVPHRNIEFDDMIDQTQCFYVGPRQKPPPNITNRSCVYILQRPDGKFYVGQTDNLAGRITVHRTVVEMVEASFFYVPVPNKSLACELETFLIHQLQQMGFFLVNRGDQNHQHFGTGFLQDDFSSPPF